MPAYGSAGLRRGGPAVGTNGGGRARLPAGRRSAQSGGGRARLPAGRVGGNRAEAMPAAGAAMPATVEAAPAVVDAVIEIHKFL